MQVRGRAEAYGGRFIFWWLLYLLLITCIPFTTIVVGRFAALAPAVWLYAGNTALIALTSWRMLASVSDVEDRRQWRRLRDAALLLFGSAVICIGWSFVDAPHSLWALMLNLLGPLLIRRRAADREGGQP
ncbi:MAG: hypothetical protein KGL50_15875 [Burkholderiales bacterium]|nr:hypothetical protein [Burkholderiales bacterium]